MPDESLLAALQTLRDEYSQKQKATNNLIKALKGKASAFGKIQAAMSDYAASNASIDQEPGQRVQEILGSAQENVNPLITNAIREAKELAALVGALKGIIGAMSTSPVDVVRLSHPFETLKTVEIADDRIMEMLPHLDREMTQAQEALEMLFGAALRDSLAGQGLEIGGKPPNFEIGRFEVAANFKTRSASINYGNEMVIKRVPLSIEAVIKAYQTAAKMIVGRNENPETWIAQFYSAWEAARRKRDPSNTRVNVIDCYFEMVLLRQSRTFFSAPSKGGFADYSRAQFAYDLQEIAIRPHRSHNGKVVFAHSAIRTQVDSSTRSLWIVEGRAPHDGRYVGDIVFDKDE